MPEQEADTERVSIRTYLPQYQRDVWDEHADDLDMSRSEYVKAMVQAGRRGFLGDGAAGEMVEQGEDSQPERGDATAAAAVGAELETAVVDALSTEGYLSWDELLAAVTDDVEDRLETTLQELQAEDRIRYSGRNGGYTLDE